MPATGPAGVMPWADHGSSEPRHNVGRVNNVRDESGGRGGDMAMFNRDAAALGSVQQTPHGCDCLLGLGEAGLETGQMVGDHPVAGLDVGSAEHNLDVLERHVKVAESADDLRRDDLLWCVAPVSAVGIHVDRLQ
jgi:hypothetical protein